MLQNICLASALYNDIYTTYDRMIWIDIGKDIKDMLRWRLSIISELLVAIFIKISVIAQSLYRMNGQK